MTLGINRTRMAIQTLEDLATAKIGLTDAQDYQLFKKQETVLDEESRIVLS